MREWNRDIKDDRYEDSFNPFMVVFTVIMLAGLFNLGYWLYLVVAK